MVCNQSNLSTFPRLPAWDRKDSNNKIKSRSLKRTLMDHVEDPLSALIIDGQLHEGDTVVVEADKARKDSNNKIKRKEERIKNHNVVAVRRRTD